MHRGPADSVVACSDNGSWRRSIEIMQTECQWDNWDYVRDLPMQGKEERSVLDAIEIQAVASSCVTERSNERTLIRE